MDIEDLSCAICLELYQKPTRITSCGHSFCQQCLLSAKIEARWPCPICNKLQNCEVNSLPQNFTLEQIVDSFNQRKSKAMKNDLQGDTFELNSPRNVTINRSFGERLGIRIVRHRNESDQTQSFPYISKVSVNGPAAGAKLLGSYICCINKIDVTRMPKSGIVEMLSTTSDQDLVTTLVFTVIDEKSLKFYQKLGKPITYDLAEKLNQTNTSKISKLIDQYSV